MKVRVVLSHAEIIEAVKEHISNSSELIGAAGLPEGTEVKIVDIGAGEFEAVAFVEEKLS